MEKVVDIILLHLRRVDQIEIKHKTSKLKKETIKIFWETSTFSSISKNAVFT